MPEDRTVEKWKSSAASDLATSYNGGVQLEEQTEEEEDEHKKEESLNGEIYIRIHTLNVMIGNIKGDGDAHLDHHVKEVEPLELPPAGHLRLCRVPEDKVPDPLKVVT